MPAIDRKGIRFQDEEALFTTTLTFPREFSPPFKEKRLKVVSFIFTVGQRNCSSWSKYGVELLIGSRMGYEEDDEAIED